MATDHLAGGSERPAPDPPERHGSVAALPSPRRGLPGFRLAAGVALAVLLPALLTWVLLLLGPATNLAGDVLVLLIGVVVTAVVGGLWPALLSATISSTLLNYHFIPPVRTLQIAEAHNVFTVVGFVVVAALVSMVVHRAATTASAAQRAAAEARTLAQVAQATVSGHDALPTLLEQLRASFGMTSASLLARQPEAQDAGSHPARADWRVVQARGAQPPQRPEEADVQVAAGDELVIALCGRSLGAGDREILKAFAAQVQGALERDRLARSAAAAARLEASERLRDALLAAVGHDLRTPLASARAAVSSLRTRDVAWSAAERDELLETAEESLQRLSALVADLLDLSRLKAGVLKPARQQVWFDELVPPALAELGPAARVVALDLADDLPSAVGDAALVTRALVNVIDNALKHGASPGPPLVTGSERDGWVQLRVIDHGPGLGHDDQERVFQPFQRLGDTDNTTGLGLGLALSRGLVEAMHGTLRTEPTPGGGLTVVLSLPAAAESADPEAGWVATGDVDPGAPAPRGFS